MAKIGKQAIKLASEILAQPEFRDLTPLGAKRPKLIRCNAGSFIRPNHICYGEHPEACCQGCKYKARALEKARGTLGVR